ncbi:MAG: protein phosphatase 2C domain-containing protein [Pseudomonadota bacterium]
MHFELLQSISLNGNPNKPNDDRAGATSKLAWVIDGATDLGEPGLLGSQGGAAWLATTANTSFAQSDATTIQATCEMVFAKIEEKFEAQKTREVAAAWEVPKAAFAAAQLTGNTLGVAWAADCPMLQVTAETVRWCTGEPDTSEEASDAMALGTGVGAASELTGAVLEDRRNHRARGDHFALSSNKKTSSAVTRYAEFSVSHGDELILMSDGFASLVTDYNRYSAGHLVEALRAKGMDQLTRELRKTEQEDAACERYPRFKVSDDATALWVRVWD